MDEQKFGLSNSAIYGSFGGTIFGGTAWLILLAAKAGDWIVSFAVFCFAVWLFWYCVQKCKKSPAAYYSIARKAILSIGAVSLLVVNLRWNFFVETLEKTNQPTSLWLINLIIIGVFFFVLLLLQFKISLPAGPPAIIKQFSTSNELIQKEGVQTEGDSWRIEIEGPKSIPLFEISNPGVEQVILSYRAMIKGENLEEDSYIEMWCRFPDKGEFFSKALNQKIIGTTDWISAESRFFLKKGLCPDLIRLNLAFGGKGTIWIKNIELLKTPLK